MELKIDADFENCLPMLSNEEYSELEKGICKNGILSPILVWNGIIVDGHNRYKICKAHMIENVPTKEMAFSDKDEAILWILTNQLGRRNLTNMQRDEIALKYRNIIASKAKDRQREGQEKGRDSRYSGLPSNEGKPTGKHQTSTDAELGRIAGTSESSIYRTRKILNEGTQEQIERARKGGKGNSMSAIVKEIDMEKKGVETRKCSKCGKILPVAEFYPHHPSNCKKCHSSYKSVRDIKGNVLEISPELRNMTEADIIGDLYDTNKVIEYTDDDLKEELVALIDRFKRSAQNCLKIHTELIDNEESKEKVLSNLTFLQHEIQKWKELYNYE